jgi:hypothetical protein
MNIEDNTEDQFEIDLGEDPKPAEDIIVEKSEEKPAEADPVDNTLETLKEQLENERRARQEAQRRASEAEYSAYEAQGEVQDTSLHLVSNAIDTVIQNNNILKANYRDAMAMGDFDTAADIQSEMSSNAAKLLQLEQGKQALENQPRQPAPTPYVADPVEALASQLSPRSADWVRRNPQYATDPRLYQKMLAAHNLAMADDIPADSDDYFDAIEDTLRIRRQDNSGDYDAMADAAKPTQRRSAPPAAPVSRSGGGGGSKPNRVTLTAAEREMASMMGMTPEEYGRNKLTLQKEGKLN